MRMNQDEWDAINQVRTTQGIHVLRGKQSTSRTTAINRYTTTLRASPLFLQFIPDKIYAIGKWREPLYTKQYQPGSFTKTRASKCSSRGTAMPAISRATKRETAMSQ